jgi:hypothetical protein
MSGILYNDAVQVLLQRIPEIHKSYTLVLNEWHPEEIPAHIVYGSIFPTFVDSLEANWRKTKNKDLENVLLRSFLLIENLASSSDFETRCLVEASFLETLLDLQEGWERFNKLFNKNTLLMAKKLVRK